MMCHVATKNSDSCPPLANTNSCLIIINQLNSFVRDGRFNMYMLISQLQEIISILNKLLLIIQIHFLKIVVLFLMTVQICMSFVQNIRIVSMSLGCST